MRTIIEKLNIHINLQFKLNKEQAKELLNKNPHHYLWDKDLKDWTEKDIESLKTKVYKKQVGKIPVRATLKSGEVLEFTSMAEASRKLFIHESTVRSNILGRQKTAKGVKFEEIIR